MLIVETIAKISTNVFFGLQVDQGDLPRPETVGGRSSGKSSGRARPRFV